MADVQSNQLPVRKGASGNKKRSIRIDLTPMVDLGFLLITFFIFTTTLTQQTALKLSLPKDNGESKTAASKTISLLLCQNNIVKYYTGDNPALMRLTNYSPAGIRNTIQLQQQRVAKQFGDAAETVVLIKPTAVCTYENVVNVLDEMTINDVKRYILMDANEKELNLLKQ